MTMPTPMTESAAPAGDAGAVCFVGHSYDSPCVLLLQINRADMLTAEQLAADLPRIGQVLLRAHAELLAEMAEANRAKSQSRMHRPPTEADVVGRLTHRPKSSQ